jgi:hypothetical protein
MSQREDRKPLCKDQDPEMQLGDMRPFAEARGWQLVDTYIDHCTGKKEKRPALSIQPRTPSTSPAPTPNPHIFTQRAPEPPRQPDANPDTNELSCDETS